MDSPYQAPASPLPDLAPGRAGSGVQSCERFVGTFADAVKSAIRQRYRLA